MIGTKALCFFQLKFDQEPDSFDDIAVEAKIVRWLRRNPNFRIVSRKKTRFVGLSPEGEFFCLIIILAEAEEIEKNRIETKPLTREDHMVKKTRKTTRKTLRTDEELDE